MFFCRFHLRADVEPGELLGDEGGGLPCPLASLLVHHAPDDEAPDEDEGGKRHAGVHVDLQQTGHTLGCRDGPTRVLHTTVHVSKIYFIKRYFLHVMR